MTAAAPGAARRRAGGADGAGTVAALTLVFAFTFLGLVWLARDVDRSVSNRSAAQSIAFQAARAGAQATDAPSLRSGGTPVIEPAAARVAAQRAASALFTSYGVSGSISEIRVAADRVTVTVTITDAGRTVVGSGTVTAVRTP